MEKYQFFEKLVLPVYNFRYQSKKYNCITESNTFEEIERNDLNSFSGMGREQWLQSAEYLLRGIFKYVKDIEKPLFFPKQKGKSYPKIIKGSKKVAYLEGLCRTLFIAGPVLNENSDLIIDGISVANYYRNQLSNLVNPSSPIFIPDRDVNFPSQALVEFGGLAISFLLNKNVLWKPLSQEVKDKLALKMLSYGEGPYVDNNWKYFCVFILTFLKSEGYQVDDNQLGSLLKKILNDYSGDGWYLDDSYDYYSMWGYQLYAVIWSIYYGEKQYPEIAGLLKKNFEEMLSFYPYLFARDGKMLMWGRSITYRYGAIAPLLFSAWIDSPFVNHGWFRRLSSGALGQFLGNTAFLKQSIPTLGFYGAFEPCIQGYSCRASSFWLGKAYLGLVNSPINTFWNQPENCGPWEGYEKDKCYSYYSEAAKIMVTHYPEIGETEIRTCTPRSVLKAADYMRNENYNRLSYHTALPWQADIEQGYVAMNYLLKESDKDWEPLRQYEHISYEEGIFRRQVKLEKYIDTIINLVDIPLSNGVLRVDKVISSNEKQIRLGHYALPEKSHRIREAIVSTPYGPGRNLDNGHLQLLAIPVSGWNDIITVSCTGVHPESYKSTIINLLSTVQQEKILVTLLLFKESGTDWKEEEFDIIEKMEVKVDGFEVKVKNKRLLNWNW